jgi:hypothetical protein
MEIFPLENVRQIQNEALLRYGKVYEMIMLTVKKKLVKRHFHGFPHSFNTNAGMA